MSDIPIILASQSPSRLELLKRMKIFPKLVLPAHIDETEYAGELPSKLATRLAYEKATHVAKQIDYDALIIGADTVTSHGRRVLPKALTDDDVRYCLTLLSGKRHRVHTGICVIRKTGNTNTTRQKVVETIVKFKRLSEEEIEFYCSSGEGLNKAGGCGISGYAEVFVPSIYGSHSNVIGLPLLETLHLLNSLGFKYDKGIHNN